MVSSFTVPRPTKHLNIVAASRGEDRRKSSPRWPVIRDFDVPKRLASTPTPQNSTVYTLRLSTAVRRGSALSEASAGVLVLLLGKDGTSVLRRLGPLVDPAADAEEVMRICGSDTPPPPGANCSVALSTAARRAASAATAPLTRRFQEGSVDEVAFLAPELGPLAAVIVAPESGNWRVEEVNVASSNSGETARFVCRDDVGTDGIHPAAYLRPVPPGGVVYGSGDAAVVLSREQASALREWNMQQYSDMKKKLLVTTAALVGLGTGVTFAASGADLALPFALGGASSLAYQYLLQRRVDGVAAAEAAADEPRASEVEPGPKLVLNLALSSPAVRAALMAGGLVGSLMLIHTLTGLHGEAGLGGVELEVREVAAGLAGFLMQKVAVTMVVALPESKPAAAGSGGAMGSSRRSSSED